jgi:hypothetical protein
MLLAKIGARPVSSDWATAARQDSGRKARGSHPMCGGAISHEQAL